MNGSILPLIIGLKIIKPKSYGLEMRPYVASLLASLTDLIRFLKSWGGGKCVPNCILGQLGYANAWKNPLQLLPSFPTCCNLFAKDWKESELYN